MTTNLKTYAYNTIRKKIITCEYAPGSLINEEFLTADLNLSRTPVRDAISRLEQERLVEIAPKRGIRISELSVRDINMVFELRTLYETYVLQNYGMLIPIDKLTEYNNIFSTSDFTEEFFERRDYFYKLDEDFHMMIMSVCPNKYIVDNYNIIRSQTERYRYMTGQVSDERMINTFKEHLAIVRPCLRNDWDEATEKMRYHMSQSKRVTFDLLLNKEHA